jgi:hypothetical protein
MHNDMVSRSEYLPGVSARDVSLDRSIEALADDVRQFPEKYLTKTQAIYFRALVENPDVPKNELAARLGLKNPSSFSREMQRIRERIIEQVDIAEGVWDVNERVIELARRAISGDNNAMVAILEHVQPLIRKMSKRLFGLDKDEARLFLIETMWEVVLPAWEKHGFAGKLEALAKVTFRNSIAEYKREAKAWKRGGRVKTVSEEQVLGDKRVSIYPPDTRTPAKIVEDRETHDRLLRVITAAAGPLLRIAIPRLLAGETAFEISQSLGYERTRVSVELSRLAKRLGISRTPLIEQVANDGEVVGTFKNAAEAAKAIKKSPKTVQAVLAGRTQTAGGFRWRRAARENLQNLQFVTDGEFAQLQS